MRSIIAALVLATLVILPTTALAEGIYTQARFEASSLGKFNLTEVSYFYQGYGASVALVGRPDQDHLSLLVSGAVLDLDEDGIGGRGAAELHWAPRPSAPVWFYLAGGFNWLPSIELANEAQIQNLIRNGHVNPSEPNFLHIPSTWVVDLTVGFNVDIPLSLITPKLDWLGVFVDPSFGVAVGPHSDVTGNLVTRIMAGLRVSN